MSFGWKQICTSTCNVHYLGAFSPFLLFLRRSLRGFLLLLRRLQHVLSSLPLPLTQPEMEVPGESMGKMYVLSRGILIFVQGSPPQNDIFDALIKYSMY